MKQFFDVYIQEIENMTEDKVTIYTNTKNYYYKQLELNRNLYRFTEAPDYDAIIEEYNLFLEENAEKFI